jgi:hypothetical protein
MELTAYHKWLLRYETRDRIANRIFIDCGDGNEQAYDLLEATGDVEYTKDTFLKAADLILNSK